MAYLIDARLFADNLKYFRELQSYTYRELARLSYLSDLTIRQLEEGVTVPTGHELRCLADALKVTSTALIVPRPPAIEYWEGC